MSKILGSGTQFTSIIFTYYRICKQICIHVF